MLPVLFRHNSPSDIWMSGGVEQTRDKSAQKPDCIHAVHIMEDCTGPDYEDDPRECQYERG